MTTPNPRRRGGLVKGTRIYPEPKLPPFLDTLLGMGKLISATHGGEYGMCDELPLCYKQAHHFLVFYGGSVCLCDEMWEKYQEAGKT